MIRVPCTFCLLLWAAGIAGARTSEPVRVTGTVVSAADGKPMPGALVTVRRDGSEAVADPEGRYAIGAQARDTLVFRFVTFEEQLVPVAGRRRIDVRMQVAEVDINKVVVRTGVCPGKR